MFEKLKEKSNEVKKKRKKTNVRWNCCENGYRYRSTRDPRILGSWATTRSISPGSSRKMLHGFHVGSTTRVRGNSRNKPAWRTRRAMCRTWGSQWRSMARASSIRSTRSNISPAGIAGGTWTGLNPTRRMLSTVNQASHRKPSTGHR